MKWFFVIFIACLTPAVRTTSKYIVSVVDIEYNITTEDVFEMNWEISRPSRGVTALSGIVDIKEDIDTDRATCSLIVYYSKDGSVFTLTPYNIPRSSVTRQLNFLYKDYVMDTFKKCCSNALSFDKNFVSPLRKLRMICTNCELEANNYPSHLRLGYYRCALFVEGTIGYNVQIIAKLELE